MRAVIFSILLVLGATARAGGWKNPEHRCAADIPESTGWQIVEAPQMQGLEVLLAMQNPARQAAFGISIVQGLQDANLAAPANQQKIEAMLRQFGYRFAGHSSVKAAGLDWLQYPVQAGAGAQRIEGLIRYASTGSQVFGITMLRGGGQQAAQDAELQKAAASFRLLPIAAIAPATPAADGEKPAPPEEGGDDSRNRMIWYGVGAVVVLLIFFSIIGGETKKR
jgi:hypothetical protein